MTTSDSKQIPFLDLSRKISKRRSAIDGAITRVLNRGHFILGPEVERFENLFASYVDVAHTVCVANGTDAIEIALHASGITHTDTVAIAANAGNYASTALHAIGSRPFYMDVDYTTRNITLHEVERAISAGIKAIVATHLYGLAISEIAEIALLARNAEVVLIEDCAQAHGARINGQQVGSFGDAAAFSFYPTKNLGAIGDVGAVTTDNAHLALTARQLRSYGWGEKYSVEISGGRNSRADEIQAAVLADLLPYLDADNQRRRQIATMYCTGITAVDLDLPVFNSEEFVSHHFVVSSPRREHYIHGLQTVGVATAIHFPIADTDQPYISQAKTPALLITDLPITKKLTSQVFSLPCYPELEDLEVERIIDAINSLSL